MFSQSSGNGVNELGARVRALRRERGLTLKALGRRARLSHPFLSQVERGLARPSVSSVERIADALGVPVAQLWAPPRRRDAVRLMRREEARPVEHEAVGVVRELLSEVGAPGVREWSSGTRRWPDERTVAAGEVLLYVARGALDVELDGNVYELDEGDAVLFDGAIPHRLRRRGGPGTRALLVTTPVSAP